MAAEVESMFSVREVPWHGLGEIVEDVLTAKDALVKAGLDWDVSLYPLVYKNDGEHEVPDHFAIVRDSDHAFFDVCGSQYTPVQNHKSFEFFDNVVGSGEAKYETAGSLRGGKVVFLTARVPREILVGGADAVDLYLVLANGHYPGFAFQAAITPVRVVCQNTLNLAIGRAKQQWRLRHTESIEGKVNEAREALALTFNYADEFQAAAEKLIAEEFTKAEFERLVRDVFPHKDNERGGFSPDQYAMIGVLESSPNLDDGLRYTKWGALNAVAEYEDWGRVRRTQQGKDESEARTERVWFKGAEPKNKVLAYLGKN